MYLAYKGIKKTQYFNILDIICAINTQSFIYQINAENKREYVLVNTKYI